MKTRVALICFLHVFSSWIFAAELTETDLITWEGVGGVEKNNENYTNCTIVGKPSVQPIVREKHVSLEEYEQFFLSIRCNNCDFTNAKIDLNNCQLDCSSFTNCTFDNTVFKNFQFGMLQAWCTRFILDQGKKRNNTLENARLKNVNFLQNKCLFVEINMKDVIFESCHFPDIHVLKQECFKEKEKCRRHMFYRCHLENVKFINCTYYCASNDCELDVDKKFLSKCGVYPQEKTEFPSFCGIGLSGLIVNRLPPPDMLTNFTLPDGPQIDCEKKTIRNLDFFQNYEFNLKDQIEIFDGWTFSECKLKGRNIFDNDISNTKFVDCFYYDSDKNNLLRPMDEYFLNNERNQLTWKNGKPEIIRKDRVIEYP